MGTTLPQMVIAMALSTVTAMAIPTAIPTATPTAMITKIAEDIASMHSPQNRTSAFRLTCRASRTGSTRRVTHRNFWTISRSHWGRAGATFPIDLPLWPTQSRLCRTKSGRFPSPPDRDRPLSLLSLPDRVPSKSQRTEAGVYLTLVNPSLDMRPWLRNCNAISHSATP